MEKTHYLESIGGAGVFRLFDHLPGYSFFAKNFDGEIMSANQGFYERFGFTTEEEIVGKTDFELFPVALADHFRRDDLKVMETGESMLGIVELFFNRQGLPDWYLTNKMPVVGRDGAVIGVMGTVRSYARQAKLNQHFVQIEAAVDFIRDNFRRKISIGELSQLTGLSSRQFDRKFKDAFGISPQQFILKTRILAGCDGLANVRRPISDISFELGFCDQSSFTRHFQKHMGVTPLQYRKRLG